MLVKGEGAGLGRIMQRHIAAAGRSRMIYAVGNRLKMTSTGSAKPYRAESDTGGLWHMDEPVEEGAITIVDASGNENHLVGGSGLESVEGRIGKAVRFDGIGTLSCADDPAL